MNTANISEFKNLAVEFAQKLGPGSIVLFKGPMGAGKTFWVRSVVEALGGKWVSSPSFAVIQRYATKLGGIDHVDLFRLKDAADLESTGFWDLFDDPRAIVFIEWADRLSPEVWPSSFRLWSVDIEMGAPDSVERVVTISNS
ncbi:MAG: tRNA (adenosine(37)-N6)-threonylcarbamoyltransferase complex ATPase subunit type 1 TsaE [Bdellovibrionia bacterium]